MRKLKWKPISEIEDSNTLVIAVHFEDNKIPDIFDLEHFNSKDSVAFGRIYKDDVSKLQCYSAPQLPIVLNPTHFIEWTQILNLILSQTTL